MRPVEEQTLPPGCILLPLESKPDRRGWLLEVFRVSWVPECPCSQINMMYSHAGTLRGPHVHGVHADCFVMATGRCLVGLKDVRDRSPACGATALLELNSAVPHLMLVPPGVIHGLYFPVDSILLTMESQYYDPEEEIACRWDDQELGIPWPFLTPILSDKDAAAQSYRGMMNNLQVWQNTFRF